METYNMQWPNFERRADDLLITFKRVKASLGRGSNDGKTQSVVMTNKIFLRIWDEYAFYFDAASRIGPCWKYLTPGGLPGGRVGQNSIPKISKKIALWLGKTPEEADKYTGHSVRRTGATILAGSGLSLTLLMIAGNWKSDRAARGYIDSSIRTLRRIADSFDCFLISKASEAEEVVAVTSEKSSPPVQSVVNNTYHFSGQYQNCTIQVSGGEKGSFPVTDSSVLNISSTPNLQIENDSRDCASGSRGNTDLVLKFNKRLFTSTK